MNGIASYKKTGIHYSDTGTGKAVVLLHGFLESREIWKKFAKKLSTDFRVVAIDLPGHGQTKSIGDIHTMDMMARAVNQVLKHLGIRQCTLIGHSMGGYVSMEFAWLYPQKVAGLCLFHSHAAADSPEAKVYRNRTIKIVQENKLGFVVNFIPGLFAPDNVDKYAKQISQLAQQASQTSKEGVIAALEGMKIRQDRLDVLTELGVPVLFIAGKQDSKIPLSEILQQAALPAHCEVLILDDVGHMGFIEASKKTYNAIHKFIDA